MRVGVSAVWWATFRVERFRMELHPFNSFNAKILSQVDGWVHVYPNRW